MVYPAIGALTLMADGRGQSTDGIGIHMNHLAGQPIIMEDGIMMITMAGFGYPIIMGSFLGRVAL